MNDTCDSHCSCGHDHAKDDSELKRSIALIILSTAILIVDFLKVLPFEGLSWIVVIICGIPIIYHSVSDTVKSRNINTETLVTIGIIAACIINEPFAAGEIAVIMTAGELIEGYVTSKTKDGVTKLLSMNPKTAQKVNEFGEVTVDTDSLEIGDIVRIRTGEMIMADGVVIKGKGEIDTSMITGESIPVNVGVGDSINSGTVNTFDAFDFEVSKKPQDSTMMSIVKLMEKAERERIPIVHKMEIVSKIMIVLALTIAFGVMIFTGNYIMGVTILVVFCPCSLLLATPTAITAAIGTASANGILIKNGEVVERLAKVTAMAFDKTGTLTNGNPEIYSMELYGDLNREELLKVAARTEVRSEHPLGKALISAYKKENNDVLMEPDTFEMIEGMGVKATFDNHEYIVGNSQMMNNLGMETRKEVDLYSTVIYVAKDGIVIGDISLSDKLRDGTAHTIRKLKRMGIDSVLISGDREVVTMNAAKCAGIGKYKGDCRPEDKMIFLRKMKEYGENVCMVGDGINDSLAMKASFVSIGMGNHGSDIVVEAADAVMMNDEMVRVPQAIEFCRKTSRKININIALSIILNFLALGLAMTDILDPVTGALFHNLGAILVVLNSLTLTLFWKTNRKIKRMHKYREANPVSEVF